MQKFLVLLAKGADHFDYKPGIIGAAPSSGIGGAASTGADGGAAGGRPSGGTSALDAGGARSSGTIGSAFDFCFTGMK